MSYLVVGQGSMGKRRVRCLMKNKVPADEIVVFDFREDRLKQAQEEFGVRTLKDIDTALRDPELKAVIVSVPGFAHMQYCLAAAEMGKHWFCEVPLSLDTAENEKLEKLTTAGNLVGAPGCQMFYHPLIQELKKWLSGPLGGSVLAANYTFGSYLPDWHPYEDYRKFYGADKTMGGGNLDVIAQELLWIRWIVDSKIVAVTCRTSKNSDLELLNDTPDHHEIILEFESGLMLSAHFDLINRAHECHLQMVTKNSTAKWTKRSDSLMIYDPEAAKWDSLPAPTGFVKEDCYIAEIAEFISCVNQNKPWPIAIKEASDVVRVLECLELSNQEKRMVQV